MYLSTRLTLLYSILVGIILLTFGSASYALINVTLLNQVDDNLEQLAHNVIKDTRTDMTGEILPIQVDVMTGDIVQLWSHSGKLVSTSLNSIREPLDPKNLKAAEPVYSENMVQRGNNSIHFRVLTVPLLMGQRLVAVLQVGSNLNSEDTIRKGLVKIMLVVGVLAVAIAGAISWFVLRRALRPLNQIAESVDQINRADDLSRRIPYHGSQSDELGTLVEAVNQTLERLETLFTSQQRFLADVSHELRTPLTVIKGNVDLMRRMRRIDEESLISMDQEVGRLTRLVGGLLLLAQAESGKLALNMKRVELDALIVEVFQEMHVLAGNKINLHLNEIDQLTVRGDRDRLKQVFLNLISNAIQYTPPGGDVFVSLAKVTDQARVIIRDTGPGIPNEDLPHIFERFYRAEKSRTRSIVSGFGLGLSIAHWIVEHHRGRIEVESKEGSGTAFIIWLPLAGE